MVQSSIAAEERHSWLTEQLASTGAVRIVDAAGRLGVSELTVRRDLAELEERGTVRRVRGGAKAVGPQTFAERSTTMARAKSRIAQKLAALVPSHGAIAFDASSTIMRLATDLASGRSGARDLIVLTNGPDTFHVLQDQAGITPLLTGGWLAARTGSLVGPLACRAASQLAVQVFFASSAALDPRSGALEAALEEAEVKRSIAAVSDRVVLAVDSSKLGARAVAVGLGWEHVDVLVTELDPNDEKLSPYRDLTELL